MSTGENRCIGIKRHKSRQLTNFKLETKAIKSNFIPLISNSQLLQYQQVCGKTQEEGEDIKYFGKLTQTNSQFDFTCRETSGTDEYSLSIILICSHKVLTKVKLCMSIFHFKTMISMPQVNQTVLSSPFQLVTYKCPGFMAIQPFSSCSLQNIYCYLLPTPSPLGFKLSYFNSSLQHFHK